MELLEHSNSIFLISYGVLAAGFISFNNTYPKKHINHITKVHIFTLLSVIFNCVVAITDNNVFWDAIKGVFFILSYAFITLSLIESRKQKKPKWFTIFVVVTILVDIIAIIFNKNLSIFLHKTGFVVLSTVIAIDLLKHNKKSVTNICFATIILGCSFMQVYYGFKELYIGEPVIYDDEVVYLVQMMIFSQTMMIATINEEKNQHIIKLNKLEDEVSLNMKKLVEAYEKNKVESDFMTNISHEIRTPVNILYSSLQLFQVKMKQENIDKDDIVEEYIDIMKKNCSRLIKLLNDLIDSSKIEAGFLKVRMKNYEVVTIIEDITLSAVAYAERKNIELIFDTDFEELNIVCDKEKIERIMLNLLSNAIKYTDDNGKIQVLLSRDEENIIVSVKDNGIGISKNMQKQVFLRFSQVDNCKPDIESSGLGLSLTKSMVEIHGGSIWFESVEGQGSKFSFSIPIVETEDTNVNDSREIDAQKLDIELSDIYKEKNF